MGDYKAFLRERTATTPGEIVDLDGAVVGGHEGIEFYTVGQRRGLGVSQGEPRYVVRLEPENNRVVIGPEHALYTSEMSVSNVNYTSGTPLQFPASVGIKTRYKAFEAEALLHPLGGGALVEFREPQRSVTPGQAAVFYKGDVLVVGGTIERTESTGRAIRQRRNYGLFSCGAASQPACRQPRGSLGPVLHGLNTRIPGVAFA